MSYGIESKKLKRLVSYYSPYNNGEQIKYLTLFNGEVGLLRCINRYNIIDLQTSKFQGIDQTSIDQRIIWFGSNRLLQIKNKKKLNKILLQPLQYFSIKIYFIFSLISLIIQFVKINTELYLSWFGYVCNICLFILVYILLLIPQIFQYIDNIQLQKYTFYYGMVRVWRDGIKKDIQFWDLVVGDVVDIKKGEVVGADGLIIQGCVEVKEVLGRKEVVINKKCTKECIKQWADSQEMYAKYCMEDDETQLPSPIVLAGSEVLKGEAKMVVLCVGKYSRIGNFVYEVNRTATERRCQLQKMFQQISFQISKYLMLCIILLIILYWCKTLTFLIIQGNLLQADWQSNWLNFGIGVTVILEGVPLYQIFGLTMGIFYIKIMIYKKDKIWYKYAKNCGSMKQVSSILFQKIDHSKNIKLNMWWNYTQEIIYNCENVKKNNNGFQNMFIKSLICRDFQPFQVGFKFSSFFVGMSQRNVEKLEDALKEYAHLRKQQFKDQIKNNNNNVESKTPQFNIRESEESLQIGSEKQVQIKYLKGNAEAMLQQCTHIVDKETGEVNPMTTSMSEQIRSIIKSLHEQQQPSLITGYIQVHPSHPKFRQPGYKVVMLSLIGYQQSYQNEQFEALHRMRKAGVSFTLLGNKNHDDTVAMAQQIGISMLDKISIRLKGYDFNKLVGGLICKFCKKSLCICANQDHYVPIVSNQEQFNRICKHLNVISEANPIQKMTLAIGFGAAEEDTCFFGSNISDVPAMRSSVLGATVRNEMYDSQVLAATQVVLPDNNLNTLQKLIIWSQIYFNFCRRYVVFSIVPSLVAFSCSLISFILFDNFCLPLIQVIWVMVVICPILGITFIFGKNGIGQNIQQRRKKKQLLLDKISYRHIYAQVIVQVIIILVVLFFGPDFIPQKVNEIDRQIYNNWNIRYNNNNIHSGVYKNIFTGNNINYIPDIYGIYSRHFTFIFNLFTTMQFVNYLNCRSIGEKNFCLFSIVNGRPTVGCICLAVGLHFLVLFYGRQALQIYPGGLSFQQWAICLGLSLVVILVAILTRELPIDDENEQNKLKTWPNRSYNLAVMTTVSRDTLQDFQNDDELDMRKIHTGKQ